MFWKSYIKNQPENRENYQLAKIFQEIWNQLGQPEFICKIQTVFLMNIVTWVYGNHEWSKKKDGIWSLLTKLDTVVFLPFFEAESMADD